MVHLINHQKAVNVKKKASMVHWTQETYLSWFILELYFEHTTWGSQLNLIKRLNVFFPRLNLVKCGFYSAKLKLSVRDTSIEIVSQYFI